MSGEKSITCAACRNAFGARSKRRTGADVKNVLISHTLVPGHGAVYTTFAQKAHQQGYALNDQELEMGLRSLAVPLFNAQGQVQAALNVGVHAGQMTAREMIERVLPELQKAARELTLLLR